MMKKKVMPLSCLMAAAMLAGCGTAAPAVSEKTTAPAAETAEAAQKTAPADAAESEAAAMEETAGVWKVEPCYNFDEIVPLYSEWDHTAGKNAADGLYAVRDGERWSLFSAKTGNIMMQDAAQQMPYLYGTNELSVWLDDEYYNYDNFAAMREKCEGLNAELQANDAEIEVLYDGVGGYANRWIYTDDCQQSHGNHRQGKFAGVLLRCLCLGGCIAAHTAAAIRAEVLAVVDLFTTMYTNHFIVPPCVLPAVLLGLFFLPYTISIGACLGNVKANLKKIAGYKK